MPLCDSSLDGTHCSFATTGTASQLRRYRYCIPQTQKKRWLGAGLTALLSCTGIAVQTCTSSYHKLTHRTLLPMHKIMCTCIHTQRKHTNIHARAHTHGLCVCVIAPVYRHVHIQTHTHTHRSYIPLTYSSGLKYVHRRRRDCRGQLATRKG